MAFLPELTFSYSFAFLFIPLIILKKFKEESYSKDQIIYSLGIILGTVLGLGFIFKIMHWPFANFLISWSVTISLFGIAPIYIIMNYYTKINNNFSKNDRMKNILIGIFILTLLSLWYAMIDLSTIPSPYSIP